eukprot:scaffold1.g5449.t1
MEEQQNGDGVLQHEHIDFPEEEAAQAEKSRLEEEREKHRARAAKFGVEYREPAETRRDLRLEMRRERLQRPGFATGFDFLSEEEVAKRAARAARFGGAAGGGLDWQPPAGPSEDEEKRKARAERFGTEYQPPDETGLMDVDLFEARKDVSLTVPRRPEAVHVYGVDLLSTKDVLSYFTDYGPTFCEWINDSSCNVLFADAATAKRAVVGLGKPLPPEDSPDLQGLDAADPANIVFLWHKGSDLRKAGSDIPLIFRIATVEDVKPSERVASRRLWLSAAAGQQRRPRGGGGGGEGRDGRRRARPRGRGRGRGRGGAWQHDDRGWEEEGGGDVGDVGMRQQRGGRRQRKRRRDGDVEMADAEEGGWGGEEGQQQGMAGGWHKASRTGGGGELPQRETVSYDDL